MPPRIWQPDNPTPGWLQAEKESDLTVHLPLEKDLVVPMHFRRIPAGSFRMGSRGNDPSEEPVHHVKIPQDFYLGTFPVTQVQYRATAVACGLDPDPSYFKGDLRPVETVTWDDAMAVLGSRSVRDALQQAGLPPEKWHASLPNEALWEYACRSGTGTDYWSGDGEAALAEVAWHNEGWGSGGTHPVGEKGQHQPSGLYDMHGNVWEWCADVFDAKAYRKRIDGWTAATWSEEDAGEDAAYWTVEDRRKGNRIRVLRGGSWGVTAWLCRSAYGIGISPDSRGSRFEGFRLCVFPGPVIQSPEAKTGAESAAGAVEPRDEAEQALAGDGATTVDLGKAKLPAAKRPRKNPKK